MQGRLSPLVDGKIQAFPWDHWESEFAEASRLDLGLIEWTLDQHRLYDNPIMTVGGREQIRALEQENDGLKQQVQDLQQENSALKEAAGKILASLQWLHIHTGTLHGGLKPSQVLLTVSEGLGAYPEVWLTDPTTGALKIPYTPSCDGPVVTSSATP